MKLSEEIKNEIIEENRAFFNKQYGDLSEKERKKLNAFYTPGELVVKMIEQYPEGTDLTNKSVLDPTCGSGNLLMGMLIASQGTCNIYGNELNAKMVSLCRARLKAYCIKKGWKAQLWYQHIHRGNALDARCLNDFSANYKSYAENKAAEWDKMCAA